jgi:hypothetical protein
MHPRQPLLVGRQLREGCPPVPGYQAIGLLKGGDFKHSLQQGYRQHFGIAEVGLGMGRTSPVGQPGLGFEPLVHKAVEFGHLLVYAACHRSSVLGGRFKDGASILHHYWTGDLAFSTQD